MTNGVELGHLRGSNGVGELDEVDSGSLRCGEDGRGLRRDDGESAIGLCTSASLLRPSDCLARETADSEEGIVGVGLRVDASGDDVNLRAVSGEGNVLQGPGGGRSRDWRCNVGDEEAGTEIVNVKVGTVAACDCEFAVWVDAKPSLVAFAEDGVNGRIERIPGELPQASKKRAVGGVLYVPDDEAVEVLKKLGLYGRNIDIARKRRLRVLNHKVRNRGEKRLSLGNLVVGAQIFVCVFGFDIVDERLEATGVEVHEQCAVQILLGDPLGFAWNDAEVDTLIRGVDGGRCFRTAGILRWLRER